MVQQCVGIVGELGKVTKEGLKMPDNKSAQDVEKRFDRALKASIGILMTAMAMVVGNAITINHDAVLIVACLMGIGTVCGLSLYVAGLEAERTGKSLYERLREEGG